ncbi:MAG: DUF4434 domain-containing protein [Bacteroidales bacterium]|nr:DUF4434 domain-containing protein [Bacteroidales bacterium]
MKIEFKLLIFFISLTGLFACYNGEPGTTENAPVKVELIKESFGYQVYVDGEPFYINGAGSSGYNINSVASHGGNTIRTWSTGSDRFTGQQILDEAQTNGLMVLMGLDIAKERHGFDYDDKEAVKLQFETVKKEVLKYKDHPALLAWGIGNELNLHYTNQKVWDAVNEISEMIKELDPNHLTTTMLAGARANDVRAVVESCPSLDFLSIQLYGSIVNLPDYIAESGYQGAYAVTEWGATGHWEVPLTAWGQPIEENSHVKAKAYKERYEKVIASDAYHCIGSTVFLWGQKQERTPTWYGMFLESGEKTESVDVMQYVWTGEWPENRAPQLQQFLLNGQTAYDNIYLTASEQIEAKVYATDPDGDNLTYRWEMLAEVPRENHSDGGDFEPRPETIFGQDTKENTISITAPATPSEYRLFVYVFDGHNNAATANIPFCVKP